MPRYATLDEITRADRPRRRQATLDEINGGIASATGMGQTWVQEDVNTREVDVTNYMKRAGDRIQQYQQARSDMGENRLTANEQIAIVDAYRETAGLQPEGFYRTKEGAAIPKDQFAELRRRRTEDDTWANFTANLSSSVLQNAAGLRATQARISDALGITEGATVEATRQSEEVNRILQPLGGKSGFAGQAVGNVMNLFLAAGQAPAMFAASTAGSTFIDVAQRRAEGQEISPFTEWTSAIANATVEYALESFGQKVAQRAGAKMAGRIGDLRGAITQNGIRGGVRAAASTLVKHGFEQTGMAIEGAAEEGITQVLQNTIRRLSYADEQGIFSGVGEAALQGAVMPLLAAGPMAAVQHGKGRGGKPGILIETFGPLPPSPAAGDQTLAGARPLAQLAAAEKALRSEEALPVLLKPSLPAEIDIPGVQENSTVGEAGLTDKWIGDRQVAETRADIDARNHRGELKGLLRDGENVDQVDAAMAVYIDMKENSDSYTAENIEQLTPAQQTLVEQAQSLSPDQQVFADQIIAENKALGIEAMDAGIIQNFKENYSARFWRKGKFPGRRKGKFTISTPRQRQRTLPSLIEGWAKGLELEVPGVVEAQMIAKQQIAQVIHDRNLVTLGLKSGLFGNARTDEHTDRVKHPNFAKWVWTGKAEKGVILDADGNVRETEAKAYGKDVFIDSEGNLFKRANMYTDKKTAKFLNNALGSSALNDIPGVGKITKYNSIIKQMVLTAALFHHQAYLRSFTLASRGINPVKAYKDGREAIENFTPEVQELVHEGLTIGKILDFDPAIQRESTAIGEIIDKVPMASDVRRALRKLSKANTDFLFSKFGPYLKTQAALLEYRHQLTKNGQRILDGKVTRRDLAKSVSDMINDDFGGLNLQRMGRNPTAQHILRLVTLAPDWTESNVRSMVKAFKRGHSGKIYRAMWGRVLAKGLGSTILFNVLMSALDDEKDFFERYEKAWKAGNLRWLDADITPLYRKLGGERGRRKYLSIIGHFRDPVKFLVYPFRSAKNKSSVIGRMALDSLTGTDWRGREFTSFGDLVRNGEAVKPIPFGGGPINPEQFPSFIVKQAEQSTPVQAQSLIQWLRGEIDGFDAITRGVGVLTSTTYPSKRKKRRTKQKRK